MSIIHANGDKYETDAMTVSGHYLKIKVTPTGYYYIDTDEPGASPKIKDQVFTSLFEARRALDSYVQDTLKQQNKMKFIEEIAGPRPSRSKQPVATPDTE
jgi:hypothetical protein